MSEAQDTGTERRVFEFTLGEEQYCVTIEAVTKIVKASELTPMPDTPLAIAGVMNLRPLPTTDPDIYENC